MSTIVLASASLPQFDRVMILPEPREIADTQLTNQEGEQYRLTDLRGRASLVFFGFTNCPDVCPVAMAKFRQLERSGLVDPEQINFTLISVDGERDTPAAMKKYLLQFSEVFVGLTGDSEDVRKIATAFRAPFFKGETNDADNSYNVAHSTQMFLLDPSGRLRAELHNPTVEAMAGITNAVLAEDNLQNVD
jgi:protein SCO1/2